MKKYLPYFLVLALVAAFFSGCTQPTPPSADMHNGIRIALSDRNITVDGNSATSDPKQAVYIANDIVYYEEGQDFTYGEGTEEDAHSAQEAAEHTVVHITKAGTYILSGKLSKGQIAIDLGEDAEDDPKAVVTLVLAGADITCTVAPAIIFYNVYECGSADTEDATATVDTSKAGANIILANTTESTLRGAYVAKIYKPDSVELSEDGTQVLDAKKLHKYDGAVYSKMSMNVYGDQAGAGTLNIHATNEGLDSELHLTIWDGNINIRSGNDGINTNEDGVSVTTVNGGNLNIQVTGATGEGDGIDSNGWLVINGGNVVAQACATSMDAGIDSDMGIHINGGTVIATGNMLDRIGESQINYAVFQFAKTATENTFTLKDESGNTIVQQKISNTFTYLLMASGKMAPGNYTLWQGDSQLEGIASGNMEGQRPGGMTPPGGMEPPAGDQPGEPPQGGQPPEGEPGQRPEGDPGQRPEGDPGQRPGGGFFPGAMGEASKTFTLQKGGNYFVSVQKTT